VRRHERTSGAATIAAAMSQRPAYVSVDVETAGPSPSRHALLAIGACPVDDPERGFYAELRPTSDESVAEALAVSGLSLQRLRESGEEPAVAMERLEDWLHEAVPAGRPIFVGFNAPFDWMFVNDYFHRFRGGNPFGHSALDIKAVFMGLSGVDWDATGFAQVAARYGEPSSLSHHALADARAQARLFRHILDELRTRRGA
jgi:ribonuclease T